MLNCTFEVIDRWKQILDEILVAELVRLLTFLEAAATKILELRLLPKRSVLLLSKFRPTYLPGR